MTAESTPFGHKGVVYLSYVRHIHETNLEANFFLHNGSETHILAFQYYFCVTVFSNFWYLQVPGRMILFFFRIHKFC